MTTLVGEGTEVDIVRPQHEVLQFVNGFIRGYLAKFASTMVGSTELSRTLTVP